MRIRRVIVLDDNEGSIKEFLNGAKHHVQNVVIANNLIGWKKLLDDHLDDIAATLLVLDILLPGITNLGDLGKPNITFSPDVAGVEIAEKFLRYQKNSPFKQSQYFAAPIYFVTGIERTPSLQRRVDQLSGGAANIASKRLNTELETFISFIKGSSQG